MRVDPPVVFQACIQEIGALNVGDVSISAITGHLTSLVLAKNTDLDCVREDINLLCRNIRKLNLSEMHDTIQKIWSRWYSEDASSLKELVTNTQSSYKCKNFDLFKQGLSDLDIRELEQNVPLITSIEIWLDYLMKSTDYLNLETRPLLIKRVVSIFELAILDVEFREICINLLYIATDNCEDGGILKVNTLELAKKIRLSGNLSFLELIGFWKAAFAATLLEEFTCKLIPTLPNVFMVDPIIDPAAIHLFLQIKLRDKLNLPFECREMNYSDKVRLSEKDVERAEHFVKEALEDDQKFCDYLVSQVTWQNQLQKEFYEEVRILRLPYFSEMERLDSVIKDLKSIQYNEKSKQLRFEYDKAMMQWFRDKTLVVISL